jgi:PAS domain S-box-containing protein
LQAPFMLDTQELQTQDAGSQQEGQGPLPSSAPRPSDRGPQHLRVLALRYGSAVLSVLLATILRQALNPVFKDKSPFMFHFLAVLFMAWYGGLGPALLTILLGALAGAYYFVLPTHSFAGVTLADQLTIASYLITSVTIAVISDAQRKARSRLEQSALEAQSQRDAFQQSQELLATTLRSIGDAVIATDKEGCITFMNRVAERLTGWSEAEAKGKPVAGVFHITHQETGQAVESPVERVLREGVIVGLANHTVLTAREGTQRPIDDSGAPIRDRQGRLFGVVLVFRDVTEQRRAQEAQERLAAIVESSGDAIISKDLNGIITSWNPAAERLYGYPAEEAIGRSKSLVIPPDQPEELSGILRRIKNGERIEYYETRRVRKDGTILDVSISVSPLKDEEGRIIGASTIARDITERRRMEKRRHFLNRATEVLASSLEYEQTLQKVADLAVPHIADWCAVDIRQADGSIHLLALAHADPEKVQWGYALRRRYPPDPHAQQGLTHVLRTGKTEIYPDISEEMLTGADPDPERLEIIRRIGFKSGMVVPMVARGRILGAITFVATTESGHRYSVEDQVLAEGLAARAAIAIDNAQLYQAAQEEIAQRKKTEVEIAGLNARLRRAMAETHHRVKNNLQVISALVDVQAADAGEIVPTDALRRVGQHVQALATIHDLLTREAKENGDVEYLHTREALQKLRPLLEHIVGERRIHFHVADMRLPIRQGTSLAVLINELVSNAVKHGAGDIDLTLAIVGGRGQLQVRDRGPGFFADFNPGTAANTGLELIQSLSRWDLDGELTFQNHPEGGACITVTFPLKASQQPVSEG